MIFVDLSSGGGDGEDDGYEWKLDLGLHSEYEVLEVLRNQSKDEVGKDLGIEVAVLEGWRLL